jgi:glycosyltransferase involved in cell wall biosynthesis
LTYMSAGRPIVVTAAPESTAGIAVSRSGCGLAVEPENPTALAEAILKLSENHELRARYGASGRRFVCENFSRAAVLSYLESRLYECAGIPRPVQKDDSSVHRMTEVDLTSLDAAKSPQ